MGCRLVRSQRKNLTPWHSLMFAGPNKRSRARPTEAMRPVRERITGFGGSRRLAPPYLGIVAMSAVIEDRRIVAARAVSIVIPAYREAENLPVIIPHLSRVLTNANLDAEIIVVDDFSGDGTSEVCRDLSKQFPVRLETRRNERGLSSAVLRGLRRARGDVLVVMDADLSHPPEKVPELVDALDVAGVDFVLGSRYVRGRGTDDGWGVGRWLNSKIATWLARPFTTAADPMAGFFALRRSAFLRADEKQELNPIGYKIGLELIVKCGCRRVHEVPIHFSNRLHGQSKLSLRQQLNYLRHLGRLTEYKLRHTGSRIL